MNLKTIGKFLGLSVALAILALATGNEGQVGWTQPICTVTLSPSQSIQWTINNASQGDVICLKEGTWEENIKITKSLLLRGTGKEKTKIKGRQAGYPVIWIESDSKIAVTIVGLTISDAKRYSAESWCVVGDPQGIICPGGIRVGGKSKATICNVEVSRNTHGLYVKNLAIVNLNNSTVSRNWWNGLFVIDSANVSLENSVSSENGDNGLFVWDSAIVSLENSAVSRNWWRGLVVIDSANVSLENSQVSENGTSGITVWDSAKATVKDSIIENNGTRPDCDPKYKPKNRICNGIEIDYSSQTTIIDSIIRNNTHWGVSAGLQKCGEDYNSFTGEVIFQGNNQIYGNGKGNLCLP